MSSLSSRTVPVARAPGISSCMRLRQRNTVDLPEPDGPIIAVTLLGVYSMDTSLIACPAPEKAASPVTDVPGAAATTGESPAVATAPETAERLGSGARGA